MNSEDNKSDAIEMGENPSPSLNPFDDEPDDDSPEKMTMQTIHDLNSEGDSDLEVPPKHQE